VQNIGVSGMRPPNGVAVLASFAEGLIEQTNGRKDRGEALDSCTASGVIPPASPGMPAGQCGLEYDVTDRGGKWYWKKSGRQG